LNSVSHLYIDRFDTLGMPTLQLSGDLDLHTRRALEYRLQELRQGDHRRVGLDLRHIRYLDSLGVSTIVAAFEEYRRKRRELLIVEANTGVRKVLSLLDLEHMLATPV